MDYGSEKTGWSLYPVFDQGVVVPANERAGLREMFGDKLLEQIEIF